QDGDRITIAGSEQLGVPFARYLFAQAPAVRKTLGERPPGGLAHLACNIEHASRRHRSRRRVCARAAPAGFAADITRRPRSVPRARSFVLGALQRRALGALPSPTKPRLAGAWSPLNLPEAGKPAAGWRELYSWQVRR